MLALSGPCAGIFMLYGRQARWEGATPPRPDYLEDAHAQEFHRPYPQYDAQRFSDKARAMLNPRSNKPSMRPHVSTPRTVPVKRTLSALASEALDAPPDTVDELLEHPNLKCLTYTDKQGRIIGFGGLAVREMPHRFKVDGRTLYTWCAWDSLFIPVTRGAE